MKDHYIKRKLLFLIGRLLLASRWLLLIVYFGLMLTLILFIINFFQKFYHLAFLFLQGEEVNLTLSIFSLIDLALIANLIVIIILQGYKSLLLEKDDLQKKDFLIQNEELGLRKIKIDILIYIIIISSIHLLTVFFNPELYEFKYFPWLVGIHFTLILTFFSLYLATKNSK
ncbi:MAG: YqhA family protein [Alphaproteobacteria bacterium]|nr:YqhA family protein [Alphaproteobacteria bacterium]